uniref:NAD(P)(+)--arginine ADP-ribosyltransferase n=1 Tax=Neogobius melanostomus TaxID=47308 RepID=A0A8C6WU12_9GOBI
MQLFVILLLQNKLSIVLQKPPRPGYFQLDMAPDAVDDMYRGCKEEMESKVRKEYLPNEKKKVGSNFTVAWHEAEKHYNKFWKHKRGKRPSSTTSLGKEQIISLYAYTLDEPNVYIDFNNAVRTQRPKYKSSFIYHALHFFLTDAIQKLNARKDKAARCLTVYRRVNSYFRRDVFNRPMRFGSFTSASMGWYQSAARFGDRSCFEINTCFGADREVLVPPYEVFKITKVKKRAERKSLPCEVVYVLRSTGVASNLNCQVIFNFKWGKSTTIHGYLRTAKDN